MRRLASSIFVVMLLVMLAAPAAAFAEGYVHLSNFGSAGSNPGQFSGEIRRVAVDGDLMYVTSDNNYVQVFTLGGAYVRSWGSAGSGPGQFNNAVSGVAVDHARGLVYVADVYNNRIQVFTVAGAYLRSVGSAGSGDGQFGTPYGITLDTAGNLYVSDYGNGRVEVFDAGGTYARQFGTPGTGDGQLNIPNGLAVDAAGGVWVCDAGNGRMQYFDASGAYVKQFGFGDLTGPRDVVIDGGGDLVVVDAYANRVRRFTTDGVSLGEIGSAGDGADQWYFPYGAAIGPNDTLFVADGSHSRVQKWVRDHTAPVLSCDYDGEWHSQPFTVTFSAVDDYTPVPLLRWTTDGGANWTNDGSIPVSAPATHSWDGIYRPQIGAGDSVANWAYTTLRIKVDTRAPISSVSGVPTMWTNQDVFAQISATDVGSGVGVSYYDLDGAGTTEVPGDGIVAISAPGQHTLKFWSDDNCADTPNVETKKSVQVLIDKAPPTVAPMSGNITVVRGKSAKFKYEISDDYSASCVMKLVIRKGTKIVKTVALGSKLCQPGLSTQYSKSLKVTLPVGKYSWSVVGTDLAGNSAESGVKRLTVK